MKLNDANIYFNSIANIPFGKLFSEEDMAGIVRDKGRAGKLLERAIGLNNTNTNRDFEDGELKTNKCNSVGAPQETIAITQISSHVDELIAAVPFEETWLYEKIANMLYIPVCKEGDAETWFFQPSIHIDLTNKAYVNILTQLKADYELICSKIKETCEAGNKLSTINGQYIQIRTKDSGGSHPIFSKTYNRIVSDSNRAFYFKKDFIKAIKSI